MNLPLPAGLPAERYVAELLAGVDEAVRAHPPDFVVISAGFDAGIDDPLGSFTLTAEDFATLTLELVARTRETALGRVVSVLEGGYNPDELGRNVVAHVEALVHANA